MDTPSIPPGMSPRSPSPQIIARPYRATYDRDRPLAALLSPARTFHPQTWPHMLELDHAATNVTVTEAIVTFYRAQTLGRLVTYANHAGWLRLCPEIRSICDNSQDPWRCPKIGHGERCWTTCDAGAAGWPVPRFIDDRDRRSGALPIIHYRKTVLGAWR